MTLECIIASYQDGTLANQSDLVLYDAQCKVAVWHDWRKQNPDAKPDAVPPVSLLHSIHQFIESHLSVRYGCND